MFFDVEKGVDGQWHLAGGVEFNSVVSGETPEQAAMALVARLRDAFVLERFDAPQAVTIGRRARVRLEGRP